MKSIKSIILNLIFILIFLLSCGKSPSQKSDIGSTKTVVASDSCNSPDADINCCFVNMTSELTSIMKIADENEQGERIIITGEVLKSDGITPYPYVIIYAYHTDNKGYYSKNGNESGIQKWHGHLYGWCRTDSNGHYEIHSIKPARYPANIAPAHIHAALKKSDGSEPFFINDFVFKDDSLVNENYLSNLNLDGGNGIVELIKSSDGKLTGDRKIILSK